MNAIHSSIKFCTLAVMLSMFGCAAPSHSPAPVADKNEPSSEFDTAKDRAPTARTLYTMARILETQGKDVEAEQILRKIVTEHAKFVPAYCDLAETLLRQRRSDEAEHTLRAGLSVSAHDPVLTNDLGMCKLLRGEYDEALVRFTRAAGERPDDARFRGNMAVALGMLGRYSESLALYQLILPQDEAHYNLAVLCDARHDIERASSEYQTAQDLKAEQASPPRTESDSATTKPTG